MVDKSAERFPVGASVTVDQLACDPYELIAELRESEPVSWLPALNGWFVTRRDLAVEAMRDDQAFTVDDPRFTTAAVLGPSMLSLDGAEHVRHRSPFAPSFRPAIIREQFEEFLQLEANRLVRQLAPVGRGELRTGLAGPLAVAAITKYLGLDGVSAGEILHWYTSISNAILDLTIGNTIAADDHAAIAKVRRSVDATLAHGDPTSILRQVETQGLLRPDEISSAAAVLMFGAIETAEGMTTNALWHLLTHPQVLARVQSDRSLLGAAIEESLRLEPAAAVVDRYAVRDTQLGSVTIPKGDLVTLSLLGSNRDPSVFARPDNFDIGRTNLRSHVTFVQGPHGCIGLHLARLETQAVVSAILDALPEIRLDLNSTTPPDGLVFRKSEALWAIWTSK